jgi:uncharacterized protein (DUF58 family)
MIYPSRATAVLVGLVAPVALALYFAPQLRPLVPICLAGIVFLVVVDVAITLPLVKLSVSRKFQPIISAGIASTYETIVENGSRMRIIADYAEDDLAGADKTYPESRVRLKPGGTEAINVRIVPFERGDLDLGNVYLRLRSLGGLAVIQRRFQRKDTCKVYPNLAEFQYFRLYSGKRRLYKLGVRQALRHGRGTEFEKLREYMPDDEYRTINWKATAKRGAPIVSQFQLERAREVLLILDAGRLMHSIIGRQSRFDHCLGAALNLAYVAIKSGDKVGMLVFDSQVRVYLPPKGGVGRFDEILDRIYGIQPQFVESDYAGAFSFLLAKHHKRGLAVFFTEVVDSISSREAVANFALLARSHVPALVLLDDPILAAIAETRGDKLGDIYRRAAAQEMLWERNRIIAGLKTSGVVTINVASEELAGALINHFLEVKARGRL